jgi:hypothetical protein
MEIEIDAKLSYAASRPKIARTQRALETLV